MTNSEDSATLPEPRDSAAPQELPPVEPPSAGFIIQLFVIPALIVAAVIAVWVLFGRLAGGEQDWRQLVQDLGSQNEHRRWRAASGLAHLLNAERQRGEKAADETSSDEPPRLPLTQNPAVARELTKLFTQQLESKSTKARDVTHQEFLARALGSLDLPEVVLPVLQRAITGDYAADVRASAMKSIALVVARAAERGDPVEDPQLVASLIQASADDNPLLRQVAAFTLGLLPSPEALEHLAVMLSDADQKTRLNAAIALARHGRTDGFDVFAQVLQDSTARLDTSTLKSMEDSQRVAELNRYRVEQPMMLKNSLEALTNLSPKLTPEQRTEAAQLAAPIARKYEHPELRKKAADLIDVLTSPDQKNTNAKAA